MQSNKVNQANKAYRAGDYGGALQLYYELASEIGHKFFYANVVLCLEKLNGSVQNIKAACADFVSDNRFDIMRELFAQDIVVSLTSYPARINAVPETIKSILAQSFRPGKILLWLAEDQFPGKEKDLPCELLELKRAGLLIEWCEDIHSYKKLIPVLKKYPEKTIVTADDDLLYEKDWLAQLVITHLQEQDAIICHRAHRVSLDEEGNFSPYRDWAKDIKSAKPSLDHLFTGCGGVLYPPGSLHESVLDRDAFTCICPSGDDLWFWGMAVLKGTRIQVVKDSSFELQHVPGTQETALWVGNVRKGKNDLMLQTLDNRFPEIRERILGKTIFTVEGSPKVSIIIPVFNTGRFLEACLDSVLAQYFEEIEILCIDDGSTDELTKDILNRYSRLDARIRVITQPNSGPATGRNTGLKNARGQYVAFVDSDDYISREYIGNLYESARQNGSDMVVASQILQVDGGKPPVEKKSGFESFQKVDARQLAAQAILTTGVSWNKLYKKEFLTSNGIGYLDGMRCQSEDNYFTIMAMVVGHGNVSVATHAIYYYRQHDGGITKNITRDSFEKSLLVYEEVKDRLKAMRVPDIKYWLSVVDQRALRDLRYTAKKLENSEGVERTLVKKFASHIDICCIADEKYVIPTAVFLESVKKAKRATTIPSITVLIPQGSRETMAVLEALSGDDFLVRVQEVETAQFANLHKYKDNDNYCMASPSAMFKFIIPSIFGDLDRILYLDTDLMVRKDLLELFSTSMGDEYLCAVADMWNPVTDRKEIKDFECYFNSGVMLMNLARMRSENLPDKLIAAKLNSTTFNLMDQDVFNEVCDGHVKTLDIKFNFLPVCYKRHKHRFDLTAFNQLYGSSYMKIDEVAADPVVAHWAGSDKPWVTTSTLFADEWVAIRKELEIKGYLNEPEVA
ncbi:glycosyltransferase [Paraburkholderia flagellata]|uniref:glycosyltransferase n=1 Tax=Paraburkholderia flagellata TaxID=2883241 RepID=UPI001F157C46|nr:glycosyltransferase [Paraburkholderia flagellata]